MNQRQDTIQHIIAQIAARLAAKDQHLIIALKEELSNLVQPASKNETGPVTAKFDKASGCYQFGEEPAYYCPHCFDKLQQKIPTQRLNRKLRVCPQCRSSLRPHN